MNLAAMDWRVIGQVALGVIGIIAISVLLMVATMSALFSFGRRLTSDWHLFSRRRKHT